MPLTPDAYKVARDFVIAQSIQHPQHDPEPAALQMAKMVQSMRDRGAQGVAQPVIDSVTGKLPEVKLERGALASGQIRDIAQRLMKQL